MASGFERRICEVHYEAGQGVNGRMLIHNVRRDTSGALTRGISQGLEDRISDPSGLETDRIAR